MNLPFHIAHQSTGRTRIRWSGDREERDKVVDVAARVDQIEGVFTAEPRRLTGSIIIDHPEASWAELEAEIRSRGQIELAPLARSESGPRTGLQAVSQGADRLNAALSEAGIDNLDLKNLAFLVLVTLAIVQAARGQVMVSAVSLLWYAIDIANRNAAE